MIDISAFQLLLTFLTGWLDHQERDDLLADIRARALGRDRAADFFTTAVWTWRGVMYYSGFVIDLASRRLQIAGSTPHPDTLFIR